MYLRSRWTKVFSFGCALLLGFSTAFLLLHAGNAVPTSLSTDEESVVKRFVQIYFDSRVWDGRTSWLGVTSLQNPCDNWAMQEIIAEVKPDFIIESGTYNGGTSLFYASILALVNPNGKVITIDVNPQVDQAAQWPVFRERVEVITGSSVSPEVVKAVAERVRGGKVLVTLDSLHTKEHVLKEIQLYSPLVSTDSYLVVQDTVVNGHPILPDWGEGPMEAVEEFLKTNQDFVVDRSREKFLLTFYPSGYLKRVK